MTAISQAHKILGWYDNLRDEHIPPRWMWHLDEELEVHFEKVRDELGMGSSEESKDMERNEYAKGRGRHS